ncbi:MAG: thiamine pyrophosphate-dependent enzyme [Bacteriovoracaceae bacterium]|nr:thiamine pyrophosphate-dependent enzyme [Bacteriovoracaceae bacterium]
MSTFPKNITVEEIVKFESDIADLFRAGKIKAPVHLRSGCEQHLIDIFKPIVEEDWIFSYWASHIHCLLKGVSPEDLKQQILEGKSISLCFPEKNIYCSGIVGSLAGVAVGTAWGIKKQGKKGTVYLFTGDMGSECGIFHESVKYALNFDLPIKFIVEDNGVSVMTDTRQTWGSQRPWFENTIYSQKIIYYKYENSWPHSGLGQRIAF